MSTVRLFVTNFLILGGGGKVVVLLPQRNSYCGVASDRILVRNPVGIFEGILNLLVNGFTVFFIIS
jgi:hypothetical protein